MYDDVMNQQRTVIYNQRGDVLNGSDLRATLDNMIREQISSTVDLFTSGENPAEWNLDGLRANYINLLTSASSFRYTDDELEKLTVEDIKDSLTEKALSVYHEKDSQFGEELMREVERVILLRNVDTKWMDHIDAMEELKGTVGLNAYANRNPINEYRLIGADMFDEMVNDIRESTVRMLLTVAPQKEQPIKRVQVAKPLIEGFAGGKMPERKPAVKKQKVGRNDPCPCGSGKKYKKCCGLNQAEGED
jgi:preprotein translocase subunit SecA